VVIPLEGLQDVVVRRESVHVHAAHCLDLLGLAVVQLEELLNFFLGAVGHFVLVPLDHAHEHKLFECIYINLMRAGGRQQQQFAH